MEGATAAVVEAVVLGVAGLVVVVEVPCIGRTVRTRAAFCAWCWRCTCTEMSSPRVTRSGPGGRSGPRAASDDGRLSGGSGTSTRALLMRIAQATKERDVLVAEMESLEAELVLQTDYLKAPQKLSLDALQRVSDITARLRGDLRTSAKDVREANEKIIALEAELQTKRPLRARSLPNLPPPSLAAGASASVAPLPSPPGSRAPPTLYTFMPPSGPASDSSLSKRRPSGPCASLMLSHDPTDPPRIFPALRPDEASVSAAVADQERARPLLESLVVMSVTGKGVLEQASSDVYPDMRTVSSEMAKLDEAYKPDNVKVGPRMKLRSLHLPGVYCSDLCEVDAVYYIEVEKVRRVLAVHEFKAPGVAPGLALSQAAKYACAAAAGLCQGGVPCGEVIVPLMVSTGTLELHGAAYMADGLLPVAVVTSTTLDLTSKHGAVAAHLYRVKAAEQVKRLAELVRGAAATRAFIDLRKQLFPDHGGSSVLPRFRPAFSERAIWAKWGVVSVCMPGGLDAHFSHLCRSYQALCSSRASPYVCFPFCVATGIEGATAGPAGASALLFPNLKAAGFRCGLPDKIDLARMYVTALVAALRAIHGAGLIHGDVYISNVMWRLSGDGGSVDIKVIDWDTVFFACDGVPKHWAWRWKSRPKWRLYKQRLSQSVRKAVAVRALDEFMVDTLDYFCSEDEQRWQSWMAAANEECDMGQLNQAFLSMQKLYADHKNLPDVDDTDAADDGTTEHEDVSSLAQGGLAGSDGRAASVESSSPPKLAGKKRGREEVDTGTDA